MIKKEKIFDAFKNKLEYGIALCCFIMFLLLDVTKVGTSLEYGLYDTLLAIKPEISQKEEIVLLDIDDYAIEQLGAFPWTRDIIADALIRLREAGGSRITFDIEYMTPGQSGVNTNYVKNSFPAEYKEAHEEIVSYLDDYTNAIVSGSLPLDAVADVGADMNEYVNYLMEGLSDSITSNIFRDNDEYFGKAIQFFKNSFLTINYQRINEKEEALALEKWARNNMLHTNIVDPKGLILKENLERLKESDFDKGISPAIYQLLSRAKGAGFPNVVIDEDGVRRRIELLAEYEDAYVAQLVFEPILDILQPEKIVRKGQKIILVNAKDPKNLKSGTVKNLTIPLDSKGNMLIHWLKRKYTEASNPENGSFKHVSVYSLILANEAEEKLITNLQNISELGVRTARGYLPYYDASLWMLSYYNDLEQWKNGLLENQREDFDEYFQERKIFFETYYEFLNSGFETEIIDTILDIVNKTGDIRYVEVSNQIAQNWLVYKDEYDSYTKHCADLAQVFNQAFCIIGWSGLGTSDLGVTPFQKEYPNVGTHANIYNTIMNEAFINPFPLWASWLVALAFSFLVAYVYRRLTSLRARILSGFGFSILVYALLLSLFVFFNIYIQVLVPLFTTVLTFILITLLRFVFSEQEKAFLRKAFTTYLSSDVVDEIVNDPSLLKLGGQEKLITAFFTDIKGFSSLSEKVTPEHLVQILNRYLTTMSDIVLEQKGTIDKYIGDAIVAFFGAPLDLPDHAIRACMAAVRMKQAEAILNEEMLASGECPEPIYTRIGVNTGRMVVGNMGTDNKMNYTIMGNDVNLTARLEGVNKAYGTWILISETTWNETHGTFLGRKLDRVRVVGIDTPVQLWNVMGVLDESSETDIEFAKKFTDAIDAYREMRFAHALISFHSCLEIHPEDYATKMYIERIVELQDNGIPEDWSDVINMTSK